MNALISSLLTSYADARVREAGVIPWSSPIPVFGSLETSRVATVGLNPSNREFVDLRGAELIGNDRRFETLRSLGLQSWKGAERHHVSRIAASLLQYFERNPYDAWFKRLDGLISATRASFYAGTASHVDLTPFATFPKWSALSAKHKKVLLHMSGNTVALMVRDSPIRVLVLNGASVVYSFQKLFSLQLEVAIKQQWSLRADANAPVLGYAYRGETASLGDVALRRSLLILGFNHNIQSSFGVTRHIVRGIQRWIGSSSERYLAAA
jgi:hypothetical protein